jgi:protein gp37
MKTFTAPKTQTDPANWWHYSANQWWGCEKISPACKFCYAEAIDKSKGPYLDPAKQLHWGPGVSRLFIHGFAKKMRRMNAIFAANPHLDRPRVFCDSMSDWLDPAVPVEWLWSLIETIKDCKAMDFLLLTKRPELFQSRLLAMAEAVPASRRSVEWWLGGGQPDNVWAGATVESAEYLPRIDHLLNIGSRIHWLSCEPLLGSLYIPHLKSSSSLASCVLKSCVSIDWVVIGGESGKHARPSNPFHVHRLALQCRAAGVPIWFKQWGEWVGGKFHPSKSKVMLENGLIYWVQNQREREKLHFWGEKDGVFDVISQRVGMNPKPLPKMGSGPPEFTDNHLLNGRIIRELPVKTQDFKTQDSR